MRIYYDGRGYPSGYSRSGTEELVWNYSVIGAFLSFCGAVILLPVYYFPRAVWRTKLATAIKVAIIGACWGALFLLGTLAGAHDAAVARAKGCIDLATAPKDYYDPSGGNNNCPDGYELGPSALTCASSLDPPTAYTPPTGRDSTGDPICTSGYQPAPRPGSGYNAPFNPHLPSLAAQQTACRGHRGAEIGPDFPAPVLSGHTWIVSCMDGADQTIPAP